MARVTFVSSLFDQFTKGQEVVEIPGGNIFQLVRGLEDRFPGLGKLVETRASIAIDGTVIKIWASPLTEVSEVTLFPRIAGG